MSRGGFRGGRGGGRGGGGGGGGPLRDLIQPTADMNLAQWHEEMRKRPEHVGMLYPPLDVKSQSTLLAPTVNEESIVAFSHSLYSFLERGTDLPGQRAPTPWRRTGERKTVGIEIETYSGTQNQADQYGSTSSKTLDVDALFLDQKNFPVGLWNAAFDQQAEIEAVAKRKQAERERQRKKRRLDADGDGVEGISDDDAQVRSQDGSGSDGEGDFDFEDEEEDHQDYDANYFDNGEGDDDDDGAGDEDGGGGDTWD